MFSIILSKYLYLKANVFIWDLKAPRRLQLSRSSRLTMQWFTRTDSEKTINIGF